VRVFYVGVMCLVPLDHFCINCWCQYWDFFSSKWANKNKLGKIQNCPEPSTKKAHNLCTVFKILIWRNQILHWEKAGKIRDFFSPISLFCEKMGQFGEKYKNFPKFSQDFSQCTRQYDNFLLGHNIFWLLQFSR